MTILKTGIIKWAVRIFISGSLLALASIVTGQEQGSGLILPKPVDQTASNFQRPDREAAVHVRYTIKADGTTADIEILPGFSNGLFEDAARRTVESWTFTPATNNGEAVDLLNQEHVIGFIRDEASGVSPGVRRGIEGVTGQLQGENFEQAISMLQNMLESQATSVFDFVLLNDFLINAYMGLNMNHEALAASKLATLQIGPVGMAPGAEPVDVLTPELLESALRKRFVLEASLSQNFAAMRTFERLGKVTEILNADPINTQVDLVRDRVESSDPAGMLAKINSDNRFSFEPARRIIAVTEMNGSIDSLDIRCQRRNAQLDFDVGVEWNLPASFGDCTLTFIGDEGTEFTLYQFAE